MTVLNDANKCHGLAEFKSDSELCELSSKVIVGYQTDKEILKSGHLDSAEISALKNKTHEGQIAEESICNYYDSLISCVNPADKDDWIKPNTHPM